jgi:hypothetical protein
MRQTVTEITHRGFGGAENGIVKPTPTGLRAIPPFVLCLGRNLLVLAFATLAISMPAWRQSKPVHADMQVLDGTVWEKTAWGEDLNFHPFGGTVTYAGDASSPDGHHPLAGVAFDRATNNKRRRHGRRRRRR